MAFHRWQIGLHIQRNIIRAVAVILRRGRWQLCNFWQIPWLNNSLYQPAHMLTQALADWRHQLPARHDLRVAYCASRTVQRRITCPGTLCEADRTRYIASATAQQLQINEQDLYWDYQPVYQQPGETLHQPELAGTDKHQLMTSYRLTANNELTITAAHQQDISALRECAQTLKLQLSAITPDASALSVFFCWLPAHIQLICFATEQHWLWASRQQWGVLSNSESDSQPSPLSTSPLHILRQQLALKHRQIAYCGEPPEQLLPYKLTDPDDQIMIFDPWQIISDNSLQPPAVRIHFAVALGLAMGKYLQ